MALGSFFLRHKKACAVSLGSMAVCAFFAACISFAGFFGKTPAVEEVSSENAIDTAAQEDGYIKWVDFSVPYEAMEKAMELDISTHGTELELHWIELLAYLGAKYGGNFDLYKAKDMDALVKRLQAGETMEAITEGMTYYDYYVEAYTAVLGEFLGTYQSQSNDPNDPEKKIWEETYGLKVYSPIAGGYYFDHYDDFCNERTYGYNRKHFGHDLMCSTGTPIVAVESGIVEELGWNQYGGWRIGIRSFDKKRYYYYAHMRKDRPYHPNITLGATVKAGDVIGYVGRTGYSTTENTNNITSSHLHWGIELIFDESQKDAPTQIWIDLYDITKLLNKHKSPVYRVDETKEYYRKYDYLEENLFTYGFS